MAPPTVADTWTPPELAEPGMDQNPLETAGMAFWRGLGRAGTATIGGAAKLMDVGADIVAEATGTEKGGAFANVAEFTDEIQAEGDRLRPTNPANPIAETIGSGAAQGATLIAGGAAGKAAGLGANAMRTVPLAMGAAAGGGQGIDTARELGVDTPEKQLALGLLFGGVEVGTEMMGGIGGSVATDMLMSKFRQPAAEVLKQAVKSVTTEGTEEVVAGTAQDLLARAFAMEDPANPGFTTTGVQLPDPTDLRKRGLEFVGGAAGGAVFAGAQALVNRGKPREGQEQPTPAFVPPEAQEARRPRVEVGGITYEYDPQEITGDAVVTLAESGNLQEFIDQGMVRDANAPFMPPAQAPAPDSGGGAVPGAVVADPDPTVVAGPTVAEAQETLGDVGNVGAQFAGAAQVGRPGPAPLERNPDGDLDLLNYLNENPIRAPRRGTETAGSGEYDWRESGDFPPAYRSRIMQEGAANMDQRAQEAFDLGLIPEPKADVLAAEIRRTIDARETRKRQLRTQRQQQQQGEQAQVTFERDQQALRGRSQTVDMDELSPGDSLTISGQPVTVADVAFDEDGRTTRVVLNTPAGPVRVTPEMGLRVDPGVNESLTSAPVSQTAQEWQDVVDDIETGLQESGVDVTRLYSPNDLGIEYLVEAGYQPMPPNLADAYAQRDAAGAVEFTQTRQAIAEALAQQVGLTPKEVNRVLQFYAIDPDKAGPVEQYLAAEHTVPKAKGNLTKQAENLAIALAAERGETFDELRDVNSQTLRQAAQAVRAIRQFFGLEQASASTDTRQQLSLADINAELAAWADATIQSGRGQFSAGIDPTLMAAYTVKGAQLIAQGFTTFGRWAAEMLRRFGEAVRQYLRGAWDAARKGSERGELDVMPGRKTTGKSASMGVSFADGESRLIQGLAQANNDIGTELSLVPVESSRAEAYASPGRAIPSYTERANIQDLFNEEARLIQRAQAEGFFWESDKVDSIINALPDKTGGSEHDVRITKVKGNRVVLRNTIKDSFGFDGRSPAQYLKRLENYNELFPALQVRVIGVSRNKRGNGVIWTAQPFVEGKQFPNDAALHTELRKKGWERIDKDYDENIIFRHKASGVVMRDVHKGNVLQAGKELYPIDVIIDEVPAGGFTNTTIVATRNDGSTVIFSELVGLAERAVRAGVSFAQWSAQMIRQLGAAVRQYLRGAWDAARKGSERGALDIGGSVRSMASDSGAAQNNEPSTGGLTESESSKDVFVRLGGLPKGGRSRNYVTNSLEKGVSVFRAKFQNGRLQLNLTNSAELGTLSSMTNRPLFIVTGESAGIGSDGEPVLSNAKAKPFYGTISTPFGDITFTKGLESKKHAESLVEEINSRLKSATHEIVKQPTADWGMNSFPTKLNYGPRAEKAEDGQWVVKMGLRKGVSSPVVWLAEIRSLEDAIDQLPALFETPESSRAEGGAGFTNTTIVATRNDGSTVIFSELVGLAERAVRAGVSFAQWSAQMIRQLGAAVRQYLQGAWDAARKTSEVGAINLGTTISAREPTMAEAMEGQTRESQFGERVQEDARLSQTLREQLPSVFAVQSQQEAQNAAAAVIRALGLDGALAEFSNNATLPMPVRIAGLMQVALQADARASLARRQGNPAAMAAADRLVQMAIEAKANLEVIGNETGRNLAMFNTWARMSPDGQLRRLEQKLEKAGKDQVRGDAGVESTEVTTAVQEAMDEQVEELANTIDQILAEEAARLPEPVNLDTGESLLSRALGRAEKFTRWIAESTALQKMADAAGTALDAMRGKLFADPLLLTPMGRAVLQTTRTLLLQGQKLAAAIADAIATVRTRLNDPAISDTDLARSVSKAITAELIKPIMRKLAFDPAYNKREAVKDLMAIGVGVMEAGRLADALIAKRPKIAKTAQAAVREKVMRRLSDKPRARSRRQKLPGVIDTMMQAVGAGIATEKAFLEAWDKKHGLPKLSDADRKRLRDMAARLNLLPEGILRQEKAVEFLNEVALIEGVPASDMILGAWYANILSGLSTQGVNIWGNGLMLMARSLAVGAGNPLEFGKLLGGLAAGFRPGLREAANVMKTGVLMKTLKMDDTNARPALEQLMAQGGPKSAGQWLAYLMSIGGLTRYVFRAMGAVDAVFWYSAQEGMAHVAVARTLRKGKGLKPGTKAFNAEFIRQLGGDEKQMLVDIDQARQELLAAGAPVTNRSLMRRAWEIRQQRRSLETQDASVRWADRMVLQNDPEGVGKVVSMIISALQNFKLAGVPVFLPIVPFNRIIANLFESTLDFTGVGILRGMVGSHLSAIGNKDRRMFDTIERRERFFAGVLGLGVGGAMLAAAMAVKDMDDDEVPFMVYGFGPPDKAKRDLMPKGWRPFVIKAGQNYVSFAESPIGPLLGAVGGFLDRVRYGKVDSKTMVERGVLAFQSALGASASMGALSSLKEATEVYSGQGSVQAIKRQALSPVPGFIPAQGFMRDIAMVFDDNKISDESIFGALVRDVPVLKSQGRPTLNVLGEPVKIEGLPVVRRFATGQRVDENISFIQKHKLTISAIPMTVDLGDYMDKRERRAYGLEDADTRRALGMTAVENGVLTDDQKYQFVKRQGEMIREGLSRLRKEYTGPATPQMQQILQKRMTATTAAAREVAMREIVIDIQ
jgi:hypothetical protein